MKVVLQCSKADLLCLVASNKFKAVLKELIVSNFNIKEIVIREMSGLAFVCMSIDISLDFTSKTVLFEGKEYVIKRI